MSDHDLTKDLKRYMLVFWALILGTLITVLAAKIHFDHFAITVTVALVIATIKASLVAGYFMHLISERVLIYVLLLFTAFFFAGMMGLILYGKFDIPMLDS